MLGWMKKTLREAVDRRVGYLLSQQPPSAGELRLTQEVAELRALQQEVAALRGGQQELVALRGALAALQTGAPLSAGWNGEGHPFTYHTAAAVTALSDGVAAVYGFDVEGHIAEFGTMTGATARGLARAVASCNTHMAHAVQVYGQARRELHLFDSFTGLPATDNPIDANSPHVMDGVWAAGTCRGLTAEQLRAEVTAHLPDDQVQIFPGWFADTVPALPAETRYALIHIDGDLYVSAMDVLVGLFSRGLVARGAYIYFDDWSCNRADPEMGERRAWRECVERFGIVASDQGPYSIFARRFTVHDYRPDGAA
jgi:hypothetical protein